MSDMAAHFTLNAARNGKHFARIELGMGYCTDDMLAEVKAKSKFIEDAFAASDPQAEWNYQLTHWEGHGEFIDF